MRVLIADDFVPVTVVLARLFYAHGHQPLVCVNSKDVLHMLEVGEPDALFLDIAMPHMDGLQIAEQIRQRPELRPPLVVAITGYSDPVMCRKIRDAGFDHHLVKPVAWSELAELLERIPASGLMVR